MAEMDWRQRLLLYEDLGDQGLSLPGSAEGENSLHHRGYFPVRDNGLGCRAFLAAAVRGPAVQMHSAFRMEFLHRPDFFAGGFGV